nr:MAG: non-structural polyprotein [Avian associated calicivirus 6]
MDSFSKLDLSDVATSINSINIIIAKYKILPAIALISDFIETKRVSRKLGLVSALVSMYMDAPPMESLLRLSDCLPELDTLFSYVKGVTTGKESLGDIGEGSIVFPQSIGDILFDPIKGLPPVEAVRNGDAKIWLAANQKHLKIVVGAIALLCTLFGISKIFSISSVLKFETDLLHTAKTITATKTITNAVGDTSDVILKSLYGLFGAEYFPDSERNAVEISTGIEKLYSDVCDFQQRQKLDYFGIQTAQLADFQTKYDQYTIQVTRFMANSKSLYNFNSRLSEICTRVTEIRDGITDLYKSAGGKQKVCALWFCGPPGRGKTYCADELAISLSRDMDTTVYSRTIQDKFHSSYKGQGIYKMDDIMQYTTSEDIKEFHKYTSTDQKDTIGASINDKGFPFVSKVMIMTSNFTWITPPSECRDFLALNRRRDYVIYVENPAVEAYRSANNGIEPTPKWYKENPSRFYLINPTFGHDFGSTSTESTLKFQPNAVWVIGEIKLDELKASVVEKEKMYREDFRQRLTRASHLVKYPIPVDPILYDESKFIENRFLGNWSANNSAKVKNLYNGDKIMRAPLDLLYSSDDDSQAILGASTITLGDKYAIMFVGPPGIGKTTLIQEVDPDVVLWDYVTVPTGNILADDFAQTPERYSAFKQLLVDFCNGKTAVNLLYATANDGFGSFPKYNSEEYIFFKRRSIFCACSLTNSFRVKNIFGNALEAFEKLPFSQRHANLAVSYNQEKIAHETHFGQTLNGFKSYLIAVQSQIARETRVTRYTNLVLPTPKDADFFVQVNKVLLVSEEGGNSIKDFMESSHLFEGSSDGYKPVSIFKHMGTITKFLPYIARLKDAAVEPHNFSRILNSLEIKAPQSFPHVFVKAIDITFGVMSEGGNLIFYEVNSYLTDPVIFSEDSISLGDERIFRKDQVEAFSRVIERHQRGQRPYDVVAPHQIAAMARSSTPLASFVRMAVPLLSLAMNLATIFMLAPNIFGNKDDDSEDEDYEDERKRRNPGPDTKIQTPGMETYGQKNGRQKSQISSERKKRRPNTKPVAQDPGQNTHGNKVREPQTRVSSESIIPGRMYLAKNGDTLGILCEGDIYHFEKTDDESFGKKSDSNGWTITGTFTDSDIRAIRSICGVSMKIDNADWVNSFMCQESTGLTSDSNVYETILPPRILHGKLRSDIKPEGTYDAASYDTMERMRKNAVEILVDDTRIMYGMMIRENFGVTNAHAPSNFSIRYCDGGTIYTAHVISHNKRHDVAVFQITEKTFSHCTDIMKSVISRKDLTTYLATRDNNIPLLFAIYKRYTVVQAVGAYANLTNKTVPDCDGSTLVYKYDLGNLGYSGASQGGDCGSPLFIMAPSISSKWCGIHRGGNPTTSVCAVLTREMLATMMSDVIHEESLEYRPSKNINFLAEPVIDESSGILQIGTVARIYMPRTTCEYKTPLQFEELTFEPSVKHRNDPRNLEKVDMEVKAINKYRATDEPANFVEWETAFDEIAEFIVGKMIGQSKINRVITKTEAINSPPKNEIPNGKPVDRSGAAGFPWTSKYKQHTSKQDYLEQNAADLQWRFKDTERGQEMSSAVDQLIADAKRGTKHHLPFIAYLKDEPLKMKKVRTGSDLATRLFFCAPAHYLYAFRRYFGTAMWNMNSLHQDTPVKVGISSTSMDWNRFAYQLLGVSEFGFASDAKNWDGTVPKHAISSSLRVWNRIYQETDPNWTEEDDVVRTTLHAAVEGSEVILLDKVLKLEGCMTSGFPATALTNSLINWALFYCVWRRLALIHQPEIASFERFMDNIALGVYGDDNICTISAEVQSWFNFNSFRVVAAEFGFNITDSQKTGEKMPDVQHLSELDFLKNGFRFEQGLVFPSIADSSIEKQLQWHRSSGSYVYEGYFRELPDSDEFVDTLVNLWPRLSLSGKENYQRWTKIIRGASRGSGLEIYIPTFRAALSLTEYASTDS